MRRALVLNLLAVALLILHGIVHGWWSGRWSDGRELDAAADRLANVPLTLGEWNGEPMQLNAKRQAMGEIRGSLLRRYVHRQHRTVLSLLIVCGEAGPIAVHTPDVCYRGAGFDLAGPVRPLTVGSGPEAEFQASLFRKRGEEAAALQIFWSWNDGQGWRTPAHPRFAFGGAPALYKLYVVREMASAPGSGPDRGVEFLRVLLPELEKVLFERDRR